MQRMSDTNDQYYNFSSHHILLSCLNHIPSQLNAAATIHSKTDLCRVHEDSTQSSSITSSYSENWIRLARRDPENFKHPSIDYSSTRVNSFLRLSAHRHYIYDDGFQNKAILREINFFRSSAYCDHHNINSFLGYQRMYSKFRLTWKKRQDILEYSHCCIPFLPYNCVIHGWVGQLLWARRSI